MRIRIVLYDPTKKAAKRSKNMNIIRANDYDDMSKKAAAVLAAQIIMKPD